MDPVGPAQLHLGSAPSPRCRLELRARHDCLVSNFILATPPHRDIDEKVKLRRWKEKYFDCKIIIVSYIERIIYRAGLLQRHM